MILVDDLGYGDLGFTGSNEISTPNIDSLAENGVIFTDGYVSYAVCSPSRAGLITGRYQDTFGYGLNALYTPKDPDMGLPISEFTIADLFKTKNYKTLAVGKWHLGAHESLRPLNRGFDEFRAEFEIQQVGNLMVHLQRQVFIRKRFSVVNIFRLI